MSNTAKIHAVLGEIKKNNLIRYEHWLACFTTDNTIVLVKAYELGFWAQIIHSILRLHTATGMELGKVSRAKNKVSGKSVEEVKKLFHQSITLTTSNATLRNHKIYTETEHGVSIKLKSPIRTFKIIKGVLEEGLSYSDAVKKAGIDYKSLKLWIAISFGVLVIIAFYITTFHSDSISIGNLFFDTLQNLKIIE